ncbi:MAG: ribonuclease E/G, partial [Pseudomonadota bacterium]
TAELSDEDTRRPPPIHRRYKIQEVIKRRQILLVQVQKEERGNKGAALTTYLSLAGRYCVLMPNTPRGGGVSRKIASTTDRKRLKTIISDLEIPEGMAVIVRTAGSERTKAEIKRDYDYLLRLWEDIRQRTLSSIAPALVHEESDIVRRAIRDLYQRDFDEVLVEGDEAYKAARSFMKLLMPSHARRIQHYKDNGLPLFHRHRIDSQLDAIYQPTVQLRSGGYIVINPTEALVSIDVNSGRSTRERSIEDTALKTNLEAADEVARQLRLRDLAGLIVIDFIDMEDARRNAQVERRLKDGLRGDRARIQVGRISGFGLLEMSRQRLRASLQETAMIPCPHCGGTGLVRSPDSSALHVLRAIEDEGVKGRAESLVVSAPTAVALFILNEKRTALQSIEERYDVAVFVRGDDELISPDFRMERTARTTPAAPRPAASAETTAEIDDDDVD